MGSDDRKLCSDEIFEILTRTSSLKTLDTCKCVSKNWNQMAYESSFMPLYCKRTNNISGYFIQVTIRTRNVSVFVDQPEKDQSRGNNNNSNNDNKLEKFPADMRILASCNQGLLCCLSEKHRAYRYYVCKPATRQWQTLPNPKLRYFTFSVAILVVGSSPLRFKIVRLSKDQRVVKYYSKLKCEVFDSESWQWRETKGPNLACGEIITHLHPVVCVGSIHWLTNDKNLLVFHEANESFEKFPLPRSIANDKSKRLMSYQGKLGLTCLGREDGVMDVFIVKDYKTYRWAVEVSVSISSRLNFHCYPVGFYNAGIAVFKSWNEAVFYRLEDRSIRKVKLGMDMIGGCEFFQFRSDLEAVDLRGGRG